MKTYIILQADTIDTDVAKILYDKVKAKLADTPGITIKGYTHETKDLDEP